MNPFENAWILLKARKPLSERPHRQRVTHKDMPVRYNKKGQEVSGMTLQQWANKLAAERKRGQDKLGSGPEWEALREALMREAVMDPSQHGLGFLTSMADDGQPHLFPGQTRPTAEPAPAPAPAAKPVPEVPSSVKPVQRDTTQRSLFDDYN